jgi:SH3 domain protein
MRHARTAPRLATGLLLLLTTVTAAGASGDRWIHDDLRVDLRSGPGNEYRILEFLPSGTPVTVLESGDDWIRVRAGGDAGGVEGWIQAQYTTDEPIAADRLAEARAALERQRPETRALASDLASAREEIERLETAYAAASAEAERARAELAEVRRTASGALETAAALDALEDEARRLRERVETLGGENAALRADNRVAGLQWGAGAVALGVLLTLIVSAFAGRRRRSEWA